MMLSTCACTDTSSAEVGSSQTRNSGCVASARAIEMRWRWPPENWCGNFVHVGGGQADRLQQLADALPCSAAVVGDQAVLAQRLADDVLHHPARVQARVRVLEDHLDAPAQRAQPRRRLAAPRAASWPSKCTLPRVGSYRPTSSRATVLLPQPDSPTSASVLPRSIAKLTPSTACSELARLALDHAVEPRRRDVEGLGEVAAPATSGAAHAGASCRALPACGVQPARRARRAGVEQVGALDAAAVECTCGQRGLKAQPRGNGVQPRHRAVDLQQALAVLVHRRESSPSGPRCRGAPGWWITSCTGPISAMRPAYITATRSQVSAITPMSCVISITAAPCSLHRRLSSG